MPRASKKKPARATPNAPAPVTRDEISREAFRIYQARRGAPGDPVADWFQAERNLIQGRGAAPAREAQATAGAGNGRRGARRR